MNKDTPNHPRNQQHTIDLINSKRSDGTKKVAKLQHDQNQANTALAHIQIVLEANYSLYLTNYNLRFF